MFDALDELDRRRAEKSAADPVETVIAEFNLKYMVVNEAGKAVIYAPWHDPDLNRERHNRLTFDDLRRLHLNRKIVVGTREDGKPIRKGVADVWLQHARRRQYIGGVTFDPSGRTNDPEILNLWKGMAVAARSGTWNLLQRHIHEVICGSDEERSGYLINWMASLVQFPARQGEVAIVMRGGEGSGKGTIARVLLRILGQHGLTIHNSKHLTGNFNAHLRDCVFLFADEALYAGDKAHVGALKALITEPYLAIEAKHQNAVQAPNYVHLMMASNEEWVVPASLDARRFFVLEVPGTHVGDFEWFHAIWDEMDAGGYEAMLHDLLSRDLTGFNVRRVPETEGLRTQRTLSLGTSNSWWVDVLHRGYVYKSRLGLEEFFGEWHEEITTEVLFASYVEYARARGERHPMARELFGRFMKDMGGKTRRPYNAVVGEHITDVDTLNGSTRKAQLIRANRACAYHLGTLDMTRAAFTVKTGLTPEWGDDEPEI